VQKRNEESVHFIKDYSLSQHVGKTKQEKAAEISAEEVSGLAADIEKAHNKLLETKLMRLPGPAGGAGKFKTMATLKNTLKMGGTNSKDKLKRQSQAEGEKVRVHPR